MPGSGDSVQALKAGVMEIPDVIVVNKAEHALADAMVREIRSVLALGRVGSDSEWTVPVLRTEATRGGGIEELSAALDAHRAHLSQQGRLDERRRRHLVSEVLALATRRMRRELEDALADDESAQELLRLVAARELDPASAAATIVERSERRATGQDPSASSASNRTPKPVPPAS
jgi:LAO/AO transport system kinase